MAEASPGGASVEVWAAREAWKVATVWAEAIRGWYAQVARVIAGVDVDDGWTGSVVPAG